MVRKIKNSKLIQNTIEQIVSEKGKSQVWKDFIDCRQEEVEALYQDYLRDLAYERLKGTDAIRNQSIDELPLDSRAKNLLIGQGINTVRDLIQYSFMDISHFNSLGRITLQEIEDYLKKVGLELSKINKTKL